MYIKNWSEAEKKNKKKIENPFELINKSKKKKNEIHS